MVQKRRTAPTKITPEQEQRVESVMEQFQNRWGINFNEDVTREIISRTTEQITQPDAEIKIRSAVRNQMFAMLIERAPEKAIKLRMNMKEKRGAEYSKAEKQRVMDVARSKGWRAARAELSSIEKGGKKAGGTEGAKKKSKPKKPNVAGGKPKKEPHRGAGGKKAAKAKTPERETGQTATELLQTANKINNQMGRVYDNFRKKLAGITNKYKNNVTIGTGNIKARTGSVGESLENTEYSREVAKLERETLVKLNRLKERRDTLVRRAMRGMGYKEKKVKQIAKRAVNIRGQVGEEMQGGPPKYSIRDLTAGVNNNIFYTTKAISRLGVFAKAKKVEA